MPRIPYRKSNNKEGHHAAFLTFSVTDSDVALLHLQRFRVGFRYEAGRLGSLSGPGMKIEGGKKEKPHNNVLCVCMFIRAVAFLTYPPPIF